MELDLFDEEFSDGETEVNVDEDFSGSLSITREHALRNYQLAGTKVAEKPSAIKVEDFADVMDKKVEKVFDEVVERVGLPYKPVDFQRIGAVALGTGRSVVMVVGTGEGKMTVPLLASLIVRQTQNKPKGVTVRHPFIKSSPGWTPGGVETIFSSPDGAPSLRSPES